MKELSGEFVVRNRAKKRERNELIGSKTHLVLGHETINIETIGGDLKNRSLDGSQGTKIGLK